MEYVSGEIFTVNGFERGYLGVENHKIMDRGKGNPPKKTNTQQETNCPICGAIIKKWARKCPVCRKNLQSW